MITLYTPFCIRIPQSIAKSFEFIVKTRKIVPCIIFRKSNANYFIPLFSPINVLIHIRSLYWWFDCNIDNRYNSIALISWKLFSMKFHFDNVNVNIVVHAIFMWIMSSCNKKLREILIHTPLLWKQNRSKKFESIIIVLCFIRIHRIHQYEPMSLVVWFYPLSLYLFLNKQ